MQVSKVRYCPMAAQWLSVPDPSLGRMYCAVDYFIASGFSPALRFNRAASLLDGADCCYHELCMRKEGVPVEDDRD